MSQFLEINGCLRAYDPDAAHHTNYVELDVIGYMYVPKLFI